MKNQNFVWLLAVVVITIVIYCFKGINDQNYVSSDLKKPLLSESLRLNKDSCQHLNSSCYSKYFKNVALIIVYNSPFYDTIPLLSEFYGPIFQKIFFCGSIHAKLFTNVTVVNIHRGIFGYECLAEIIRSHHNYEGYLYINDDVILNYWNLIERNFSINSIWLSNNQYGYVNLNESIPRSWYWWVSPFGFNNTKHAVQEIHALGKRFKIFHQYFQTYIKNGNHSPLAHSGRSDILYIPRKYAIGFQELSSIFYKYQVFLEIAVPTIVTFLTTSKELHIMNGFYIPGDVRKNDQRVIDSRIFWTLYLSKPHIWFIHPFKLHHKTKHNSDLNLILLKHLLIEKTQRLIQC